MAIVSVKSLSQLEGQNRIDAEYYQPEYGLIRHKLNEIETRRVKELSTSVVSFGAYSLCNYIEWREEGVPYLNVENIRDGYIDFEEVKHIDENVNEILKKSQVREGQVILTMAGTIGNAAVAYKLPGKVNSNQATAKITLKPNVSPFFIAAFLNSYFGRKQTEWEIVTSVQPNIFLWQIENIRVPLVSKELEREIEAIYREGLDKLDSSKSFYSQAENLLLEKLGLKDFHPKYELSYTASLSKTFGVHRVDAEYFQPAYDQVAGRVVEYENGHGLLSSCAEAVKADFDPGKFPSDFFRYVELADIDTSIGIIRSASEIKGEEAPSRARRILKRGDVIVSSVEGSLDKAALVDEEYDGSLASTGFFQFRAKGMHPEVLLVLAKSMVLQAQLKRECTGTILTAVPNESLKRIILPTLPPDVQQRISALISQSHEARRKARDLLEEVKRKVEQAVETASP